MRKFLTIGIIALAIVSGYGKVITYPAGEEVVTLDDYRVRVRQLPLGEWEDIAVYPVKVDQADVTGHNVRIASMAYFDFDGEVEVEVIPSYTEAEQGVVRPLSYGIRPTLNGDTLRFSLINPANLSVEFNGDIFRNLHLFANPVDVNRPNPKELKKNKKWIYFAPGLHELPGDTLMVESGARVYVDGGARVKGHIICDGVEDVRIFGRGEIHPDFRDAGISVKNSRNVEVDGVIVTQLPIGGSDSVKVSNVKSISSYGWGDGMNIFASSNVDYDRVFCRNSDDCHTVYATRKGFKGGCKNITMENSTLWADVAHPIMIGLHGAATEIGVEATPDTIQNLCYRNIDILDHYEPQIDYQGCLTVNCGDNNIVRDVVFDNVRIEDFRKGQLLNVRIFHNEKYCKAPGLLVEDLLFKDIDYTGKNSELSLIEGYDEERKVRNITFDNLKVNGEKIFDGMPGKPRWYKTGDMARIYVGNHVENVVFK